MKVAVLGSGPAGLFAAFAVNSSGDHEVNIFSLGEKSRLYGAQYLHRPIPGLRCGDPVLVQYRLQGSAETYRAKVYGNEAEDVEVSPDLLDSEHKAWDIRAAYEDAWGMYSWCINKVRIGPRWVRTALKKYDLIISTIPAPRICMRPEQHKFRYQDVYASGDAFDLGITCKVHIPENTVICNGQSIPHWYRASRIFGYRTAEWPLSTTPWLLPAEVKRVRKPISTNCDCWGGRVLRLGRFGAWDKKAYSDMAYHRVKEYLNDEQGPS